MHHSPYWLKRQYVSSLALWLTHGGPREKTFDFAGQACTYFSHWYNVTWLNERIVEIPIIRSVLKPGQRILEIGNVLSHYQPVDHEIVDKYEKSRTHRVINADAAEFDTDQRYDLILSISTFEHVGWDEAVEDPLKIDRTLRSLQRLLRPQGQMVFTVPVGYNPHLDALLRSNRLPLADLQCMKRTSVRNEWQSCGLDEAMGCKFGSPWPFANGIVVGRCHAV